MRERFVVRTEPFGYTLFDRIKLRHKFLKKEELNDDLTFNGIKVMNFEKLDGEVSNLPNHLLYAPIRVYYELTRRCNLRCKFCFNNSGNSLPNEMKLDDIKSTLRGLRKDNVFDIRFSGGEPTMHPNWYEIINYAKELGFSVSMNTNGNFTEPDTIKKIASLDLEQVAVSIDGSEELHDSIRGKGTFEKAVKTLELLYAKGVHLRINTVLTKDTINDLKEILDLAEKYTEEINFFYMRTAGRALNMLNQIISIDELKEFDRKIESLKPNYPHINIMHGSEVMLMNSVNKEIKQKFGLKMGGPDGFTRFNILPDGSIWPGGYTPHLKKEFLLGNIKDENFTVLNLWRNSPKLNKFRQISLSLQKKCFACPDKGTSCPGAAIEMEFYREINQKHKNPYCLY